MASSALARSSASRSRKRWPWMRKKVPPPPRVSRTPSRKPRKNAIVVLLSPRSLSDIVGLLPSHWISESHPRAYPTRGPTARPAGPAGQVQAAPEGRLAEEQVRHDGHLLGGGDPLLPDDL